MDQLDHGVCSKCGNHCGCSFNPTSRNDFCDYHYKQDHDNKVKDFAAALKQMIKDDREKLDRTYPSSKHMIAKVSNRCLMFIDELLGDNS
jgi:hypothetical protein